MLADARLLEEAGCFALVLEKIPRELAARVAEELSIPVIGTVQAQTSTARSSCSRHARHHDGLLTPLPAPLPEPRGVHRRSHHLLRDVRSKDFPNEEESFLLSTRQLDRLAFATEDDRLFSNHCVMPHARC